MIGPAYYVAKLNPLWNSAFEMVDRLRDIATRVAPIAISILVHATLAHFFHNITVGFAIIGFVFYRPMAVISNQVDTVINSCRTAREKVILYSLGFFAMYTVPPTLIAMAAYHAAKVGAYIYTSSEQRLRNYQDADGPDAAPAPL